MFLSLHTKYCELCTAVCLKVSLVGEMLKINRPPLWKRESTAKTPATPSL